MRGFVESTYRLLIHRITNLKNKRLYGKVVLKLSKRFGKSSVLKWLTRYWYWKISPIPIIAVQSNLKIIEEFGHIPVRRRPILTDWLTVLVGIIAHEILLSLGWEMSQVQVLVRHSFIQLRDDYREEHKLQNINMKIRCNFTLTATNQSRTLDVYFRYIFKKVERSCNDRTMITDFEHVIN